MQEINKIPIGEILVIIRTISQETTIIRYICQLIKDKTIKFNNLNMTNYIGDSR